MISIVITFYEKRRIFELCLEQLLPTLRGVDAEVIVVDDNPEHPLVCPPAFRDALRIVRSGRNLGYAGACNLGVEAARGDQVLFLDADIIVTEGWLGPLLSTAAEHPEAGAVIARILDLSTGNIAHYGAAVHVVDSIHPYQGNRATFELASHDRPFNVAPSGAMLMSRQLFLDHGGFDVSLHNAFEDFDLALKLVGDGRLVWISAGSIVFHRGAVSGIARYSRYADTKALFFRRWGTRVGDDGLFFLEAASRLLRDRIGPTPYLTVDLSSTLFAREYIECALSALGARAVQHESRPSMTARPAHIRLEDQLDWQVCRLSTPILYFTDQFSSILANRYWFENRGSDRDVVVDRNGNAFFVRDVR